MLVLRAPALLATALAARAALAAVTEASPACSVPRDEPLIVAQAHVIDGSSELLSAHVSLLQSPLQLGRDIGSKGFERRNKSAGRSKVFSIGGPKEWWGHEWWGLESTTGTGGFQAQAVVNACLLASLLTVCGALLVRTGGLAACVICALYLGSTVSIDLIIMAQKDNVPDDGAESSLDVGYEFSPLCSVLCVELGKLAVSAVILILRMVLMSNRDQEVFAAALQKTSLGDTCFLVVPSSLFTLNNLLLFLAIGHNDVSLFSVFWATAIFWTTCAWVLVNRVYIGNVRVFGILVVFSGLVIDKIGSPYQIDSNFFWVILYTFTNAIASVSNEFALKKNKCLDINAVNLVLYSLSTAFSATALLVMDRGRLASVHAFLAGFTSVTYVMVAIQVITGLTVSRLLKYVDAVTGSMTNCLRGPVLALVSPIVFGGTQSLEVVASAIVVVAGCFVFVSQGPLNGQVDEKGQVPLTGGKSS